ncbi:hypothetical protein ES705_44802 [subsurface metagenome]
MLKILEKVVNYFTWIEDKILNIIPLVLLLVSIFAVFNRYFLRISMGWYEEISIYLFMLLVYWGASKASRDGSHYNVTIIIDRYKGKVRSYLGIIIWSVCLFISLLGAYSGIQISLITTMKTVSLKIPNSIIVFSTMAIGFIGMSVKYLYKIINQIKNMKEHYEKEGNTK